LTISGAHQPSVEAIDITPMNQSKELAGQAARLGDLRLNRAQGADESTVLGALWYLVPAFAPPHQPPVDSL
jgi:hypothetical protein